MVIETQNKTDNSWVNPANVGKKVTLVKLIFSWIPFCNGIPHERLQQAPRNMKIDLTTPDSSASSRLWSFQTLPE